ncbi:MAG TPA: hypothetical protein VNB22_21965 [Pyrinomonadaceae bacterium]|jgi:hypothetical protein|nr:hypothetical protein [Pyrinomonadaceae bacterium]
MLGLETLDVVIGMIFVFLTLSLVCSAVNEIIEAWFNKRAQYLEKGMKELLSDPGTVNSQMMAAIYNHPLIAALFRGKYGVEGNNLPSYIPAENFAGALIDVFLNSSNNPGTNITSPPTVVTSPPSASFSIDSLRTLVDANITDPVLGPAAKALRALLDSAGNNPETLKKSVENWFDSSMDRVSGWYKRRTQVIILVLGLVVAIGTNADSITISNSLSHDKALRDSLVKAAEEYAKNDASQPGTNTPCSTAPNTAKCKLDAEMDSIRKLGLPIGWNWNDPNLVPQSWEGGLLKIFGWLITAFAISLGAPFWFDLLNKFMVVRSTVKPKEKSADEPSK